VKGLRGRRCVGQHGDDTQRLAPRKLSLLLRRLADLAHLTSSDPRIYLISLPAFIPRIKLPDLPTQPLGLLKVGSIMPRPMGFVIWLLNTEFSVLRWSGSFARGDCDHTTSQQLSHSHHEYIAVVICMWKA
jgi:hypothetical protein